jgi:hypothetical protein
MKTIIPEELFISQRVGVMEKHVDENGVRWYDFEKVIETLNWNVRWSDNLYKEIEDYNKDMFEVLTKKGYSNNKRFITSEAMCKLLNNARRDVNEIFDDFLKAVIEDEKHDSMDYSLYEQQVEILSNAINSHDDEFICKAARQIAQTDVYKNTLDKVDPTFDKEIEDAVDEIRDYLYNNEVNWILLGNDDSELFKLNKEDDVWSSWWSHEE